jgi:hypothetical protein
VLDVGGNVGALVLYTPADLAGEELQLLPGDPGHSLVHTEVRERRLGENVLYAAVYAALLAGDYVVERSGQRLHITGGEVLEMQWDAEAAAKIDLPEHGHGHGQAHDHPHDHPHPVESVTAPESIGADGGGDPDGSASDD